MRRILRFIDWRLVLAVAFLLLVGAVVQSSLDVAHDRDRLAAEVIRKDRVASAEREAASAERDRMLEGQRRLEAKYDALLSQQARLVSWLNGRGIFIPESVLRISSDDDNSDGDGGGGSSSTGGSGKQLPPKSGSAPDPVPHSSGGSGKGQGTGGGHDKGHGSSSSSGGSKKAKGHAKAKGHKDH